MALSKHLLSTSSSQARVERARPEHLDKLDAGKHLARRSIPEGCRQNIKTPKYCVALAKVGT
jgi:hypothetical protein